MLHRSKDTALARKFLYLIAILIMLAIAAAFAYRLFGVQILRTALVPTTKFEHQAEAAPSVYADPATWRSEEHTSELQSLMRSSYAVFCLTKKNYHNSNTY